MMELREKIAELCGTYAVGSSLKTAGALALADRILAIPEIAEALKLRFLIKAGALVDENTKV
jgi:hypothetical protein